MKKIKILGHDYEVRHEKDLSRDRGSNGECRCNATHIAIDPSLPRSMQEKVLVHEVVEALNYHLELRLEHPQISAISEGIYSVLSRNGMLAADALLVK